jgi:hypothetical protein
MTNCADAARRPDEKRLVDGASILAAGIPRLRDRQSLPVGETGESVSVLIVPRPVSTSQGLTQPNLILVLNHLIADPTHGQCDDACNGQRYPYPAQDRCHSASFRGPHDLRVACQNLQRHNMERQQDGIHHLA